jgi:hypothetical protein
VNILLLAIADNGGGTHFLSRAINEHTEHHARAIRWVQNYLDYPHDMLQPGPDKIRALWDWADVVHIRDAVNYLPADLKRKPTIVTYTGNFYRRNHETYHRQAKMTKSIVTVSTPDLLAYDSDRPIWLPNARDDKIDRRQKRGRGSKMLIVHAPTVRADKGTETIVEAVEGLPGVDFRLIEKMRYDECLDMKAAGDLLIDQFKYGYGNNAIESWAMGIPVVSGALPQFMAEHERLGPLPFVVARENVESIREAIEHLCNDAKFCREMAQRGRERFFQYHHSPVVAKKVIEIYEMALDRGPTEVVVDDLARDMVMVEYLGVNCGKELWKGEISGKKYRFCRLHPKLLVDRRDWPQLQTIRQLNGRPLFKKVQ